MSKYWDEMEKFRQPKISKLKKNAGESKNKASKQGKELHPIVVSSKFIAKSWWGRAWCENLERYADYENRIDRGKRYVRAGTVIDLQIERERILAKVQGSRKTPYKVEINIRPLSEKKCQNIMDRCGKKLENIESLLSGDFPDDMQVLFKEKGALFPEPKEIDFDCSCPDWAMMCKHVAAVLYGVAVRLDEEPMLFFTLRGIDIEQFIDSTLGDKVEKMVANAENIQNSSRRILDKELQKKLFGDLNQKG